MNIVKVVIAGILFLGSWALFGYAPQVQGWEGVLFFAGIVSMSLSFALPIHAFSRS